MPTTGRIAASSAVALAMAGSLLLGAPGASAQDPDALTLSMVTIDNEVMFDANSSIWCQDNGTRSSKTPPPKGECNYPKASGPLQLRSQQYAVATVSTTSQGPANFSVTGGCAVGTSTYDPSSAPSTSVQVANGSNLYVTVLQQNTQCVLTGSTPGNASVSPTTATYSITSPINYDAITLNVAALGDQTYGMGAVYWCDDADAPCGFSSPPDNPVKVPYQESIKATLFTSSNNPATFSVTGNCAVGSDEFDPNSTPTTTAQVAAGGNVYVTALQGGGQCVMTGSTVGGGTLVPGTFTYTMNMVRADQQPNATLPSRTRMRVGQRLRLQGPDGIQTNAGQDISWRVLKRSRDNCRVIERKNGAAVLRATSRGQCRVVARAPGVANEWNRFVQRLTIRVR